MIKKGAIIIGSGQAAKPLSLKLSEAGWKTILIEKSEADLGGTCLNVGCTPTKTLIASAERMHDIQTAEKHGISVSNTHLNFSITQKRKEKVVEDSKDGLKKRIDEAENLELIYGKASFTGKKSISITKQNGEAEEYTAPYIFINAGSRPRIPDISGLDKVTWYDSTGILELTEIPEKLIVIGGGYIGLELGQMYSRFGSKVTVIEKSDQIMPGEDKDIAKPLQDILENENIKIQLKTSVNKVQQDGNEVKVTVSENGKIIELFCTHLLIATGRESNAFDLNIAAAGIELDEKGFIRVNDKLETNVEGIYALGDINGGPAFTHIAYNDFVIVYKNVIQKKDVSKKGRIVPYCMYTDPQLGRVGLSEDEARKKGLDISVIKIPGSRITRGIETGKIQGPWKAIVDNKSGNILGAAIVCTEGGEIASIIQMAMEGGIPAKQLATTIFSHPSYAESINTLFMELPE